MHEGEKILPHVHWAGILGTDEKVMLKIFPFFAKQIKSTFLNEFLTDWNAKIFQMLVT